MGFSAELSRAMADVSIAVAFRPGCGYTRSTDGLTFWETFEDPQKLLEDLRQQLTNGQFVFSPLQKIVRKRLNGKERIIYVATWRDKIVDKWLSYELNGRWQSRFSNRSFAFREKIGIDVCCRQLATAIRRSSYFLKRDISNFYYTIDPKILLSKLDTVPLNPLIRALIKQRVYFKYRDRDGSIVQSDLGIAFGSSLSCVLSNVYLTDLDYVMEQLPVAYFRYADDIMVCGMDQLAVENAEKMMNDTVRALKLSFKDSHNRNLSWDGGGHFEKVERIPHLGLLFSQTNIRMDKPKFRKILRLFKREYRFYRRRIQSHRNIEDRLKAMIEVMNQVILNRIRGIGIIDYYLKHVDDEGQWRQMDRCIAELVISKTLRKRFCKGLFRQISYGRLRQLGLVSLLHRGRMLRHGKIGVKFRSLLNVKRISQHDEMIKRKLDRYDQLKIIKRLKKKERGKHED